MHRKRRLAMLEYGKLLVTLAGLAGFLLITGTPRVRADESECEHRTERADHHLHEAIEHHGWDSSQAEHARHELHEAREYCWNHRHKWWDAERHEWREEHNWDEDHGHPQ
jgi:hypothetical protein